MATERPFGVTVLAILEIISALFSLGAGALMLTAAGFIGAIIGEMPGGSWGAGFSGLVAGMLIAIGVVMVILGLISLFIAYGLWTGKGWAWTLCLVFSIIGLILSILSLPSGIISLIINILILYYLTRPHVKAFFGKGPPPEGPPPPPPP
jgi:MFS family permease